MRYEQRLQALEARRPPVDDALTDALARAFTAAVREKITRRLDGIEDTPEQAAQHALLLDQWRAVRGESKGRGARERIAARLDRMAQRAQAFRDA